jgi:hypothetical protein
MERICYNFYSKFYKTHERSSREWKVTML